MGDPLNLLIIEDTPSDADLMVYELRRVGLEFDWQRVDTVEGFRDGLEPAPDIILADYSLPGWSALRALEVLQETGLDIPFIVVTGNFEEDAIECIKQGADDYILKDRMARLGQAVRRALDEQQLALVNTQMRQRVERNHELLLTFGRYAADLQRAQTADEVYQILARVMRELDLCVLLYRIDPIQDQLSLIFHTPPPDLPQTDESQLGQQDLPLQVPLPDAEWLHEIQEKRQGHFLGRFSEIASDILPGRLQTLKPDLMDRLSEKRTLVVPMGVEDGADLILILTGEGLLEGDLLAIETFANHLDASLENVTLLQETQRRYEELDALAKVSLSLRAAEVRSDMPQIILDQLTGLLDAAGVALVMVDPARHGVWVELGVGMLSGLTAQRQPMDEGLFEQVFRTGEQVVLEGIRSGAAWLQEGFPEGEYTLLCSPLKLNDRTTGAILAIRQNGFSETSPRILSAVADMAANALNRAEVMDTLELRVRERTEELLEANHRLELLNRVKDEFVSNVSHELRTPLASLKLYSRLASESPERNSNCLESMERETDRLSGIIESLLRLSRLDQERVPLECVPLDLESLAQEFVVDRTPLASEKELALELIASSEVRPVEADTALIGQALSILLTNAIHYTPQGGRIVVQTREHTFDKLMWVGLSVSDNGPGITKEDQARLFERFYRGQAGRASGVPGTGLGLAIVKEIMELHGGQVHVESSGIPGEGSTFTLMLPMTDPPAKRTVVQPIEAGGQLEAACDAGILLVEDEQTIREAMAEILQIQGYEVRTAENGKDALRVVRGWKPCLIISDLAMPEMHGHELLEHVSSDTELQAIPFIFISARDEEYVSAIKMLSPNLEYIRKPVDVERLLDVVAKHVSDPNSRERPPHKEPPTPTAAQPSSLPLTA